MRDTGARAAVGGIGAALWLVGVTATAPLAGGHPLVALGQGVVEASPGWLATAAIEAFGGLAQPLLLGSLGAAFVAAGAAAGVAWPRVPAFLRDGIAVPVATLLAGTAAVLVAAGVAGLPRLAAATVLAATPVTVFGVLLSDSGPDPVGGWAHPEGRRPVLQGIGAALAAAVGINAISRVSGGGSDGTVETRELPARDDKRSRGTTTPAGSGATATGAAKVVEADAGPNDQVRVTERDDGDATGSGFGFDFAGMPAAVTPRGSHYVVDKNINPPEVDPESWTLSIGGEAASDGYGLALEDLTDHDASVERPVTMVCISNPVGGRLVSTGRWYGVPLRTLVERAGPTGSAVDVVTRSIDGYHEALPWEYVRDHPEVTVAYGLNGETLPIEHGPPARLLIPGRYGMKSTKWLEGIELSAADHGAYWEERGWNERAVVNQFSYVRAIQRRADRVAVGGMAFAGLDGIGSVEVSVDGGDTWERATLEDPIGEYAWRRWRHVVDRQRSELDVATRAVDGTGTVQTGERSRPHPDGSTGWHHLTVDV